jgi:AraC-like DNA-binding protein
VRQIAAAGAAAQRIARAIRWLRDHSADPLRIESLAKYVRMSPSAFHLHFKSVTAMSPLQYQKRLRLQEARRLMLGEGLDAAEAAFRVGYESPSQFSREYRRMFGVPPRQDVAALKVETQPRNERFHRGQDENIRAGQRLPGALARTPVGHGQATAEGNARAKDSFRSGTSK